MPSLNAARTAAILYAIVALCFGLLLLLTTVSQDDVSWRRIAGHTMIAVAAPLPPVLTLWLGQKIADTDSAGRFLAAGVLLTVAVPIVLLSMVLSSTEPLVMILMLFTPALQAAAGVLTLIVVWCAGAARPG